MSDLIEEKEEEEEEKEEEDEEEEEEKEEDEEKDEDNNSDNCCVPCKSFIWTSSRNVTNSLNKYISAILQVFNFFNVVAAVAFTSCKEIFNSWRTWTSSIPDVVAVAVESDDEGSSSLSDREEEEESEEVSEEEGEEEEEDVIGGSISL